MRRRSTVCSRLAVRRLHSAHRAQDVIFDGTMMWAPFVEQTIAMVRDHRHKYRRGPGYHKSDGCNVERRAYPGPLRRKSSGGLMHVISTCG